MSKTSYSHAISMVSHKYSTFHSAKEMTNYSTMPWIKWILYLEAHHNCSTILWYTWSWYSGDVYARAKQYINMIT